jgi:hypothetical protein
MACSRAAPFSINPCREGISSTKDPEVVPMAIPEIKLGGEAASQESASDKERCDFLITLLKETRYGLIDFCFKHSAIVLLFLGWIVSSDKAQEFFRTSSRIRILGSIVLASAVIKSLSILLVLAYSAMFIVWIITYYNRSNITFKNLFDLGYFPISYYAPLRINVGVVAGFVGLHAVACIIACVFIYII